MARNWLWLVDGNDDDNRDVCVDFKCENIGVADRICWRLTKKD